MIGNILPEFLLKMRDGGRENLFKCIVSLIDQVTSPQSEERETLGSRNCPRDFPGGPVLESPPASAGLRVGPWSGT